MNINRRWILVFFAAAVTLLAALANGSSVHASDYLCTGSLGAVQVNNLVVPENASCTLNGTIVNGNISVKTNATLYAYDVQVNNDIKANSATRVNVYAGSSVGGNLQVVKSGVADIQSVDINNNLNLNENHDSVNAAKNNVGGNLQANKNTGGVTINNNTIVSNLQCKENVPPPTGSGNIVGGTMEDQCVNFGEVPTPAPTSTPSVPTGTPPAATQTPGIDMEAPTVQWIAPVLAGERYNVREGEQVFLEAVASDNLGIATVRFLRWDAVNEQYVTLGTLVQPPFRLQISASTLNPEWNQVFVIASDQARNSSGYPSIWLYKLVEGGGQARYQIFLPISGK